MKIFQLIVLFILAFLMLAGAFNHLYAPETYKEFIPDFFPETLAHMLSAVAEAKYRKWGGLGFFILMISFLPIHIWDLTKDAPAIGSKVTAIIRIAVQLLFIAAGWWIYKTYRIKS